jgi:hypothetical protein
MGLQNLRHKRQPPQLAHLGPKLLQSSSPYQWGGTDKAHSPLPVLHTQEDEFANKLIKKLPPIVEISYLGKLMQI